MHDDSLSCDAASGKGKEWSLNYFRKNKWWIGYLTEEMMLMIMTIKKGTKLQRDVDDAIIINGTLWELHSTFYTTHMAAVKLL